MLSFGDRWKNSAGFWGQLVDELANAHCVLVKVFASESAGRVFACHLKKELPERFSVETKQNPDDPKEDYWMVFVYNVMAREMRDRELMSNTPSEYVSTDEASRILSVTPRRVRHLIHEKKVRTKIVEVGFGQNPTLILREDLVILANRHRWKHRKKTAPKEEVGTDD
jgi:hypothetical protein